MRKLIKLVFYLYVIFLAAYVTYGLTLKKRFTGPSVEFPVAKKSCFESLGDWSYCSFQAPNSRSDVILYVFNARGEDTSLWEKSSGYPALLQQYWKRQGRKVPTVVTITFGDSWLVTPMGVKNSLVSFDRFRTEVLPLIERQMGQPKTRFLMGQSLGGLNALSLSLALPTYFSRVAALCPALYRQSPFTSVSKLTSFALRTGATGQSVMDFVRFARKQFNNDQEWLRFSPLERVKHSRFQSSQHFYLSAGLNDERGFYEGTEEFVTHLRSTGASVHWRPNSGGHCAVDIQSLARFLGI